MQFIIISMFLFTGTFVNKLVTSREATKPVAETCLIFSRSSTVELIQYLSGTYFSSIWLNDLAISEDGVPI